MVRAYILHKPLASTSHHVSVNFAIVWIRYRTKLAMENHLKLKTPHGCHQIISVFELGVFQTMYFLVLLNCFSLHFCPRLLVLRCTILYSTHPAKDDWQVGFAGSFENNWKPPTTLWFEKPVATGIFWLIMVIKVFQAMSFLNLRRFDIKGKYRLQGWKNMFGKCQSLKGPGYPLPYWNKYE